MNDKITNSSPPPNSNTPQRFIGVLSRFEGPLPPPETLERYSQVVNGGAERIMKMAENQSAHRIKSERFMMRSHEFQGIFGQVCAVAISIYGLHITYKLAISSHDTVAGILGGTTIAALVGTFLIGRKKQEKQLKDISQSQDNSDTKNK